jgi:hypothetical protein
MTGGNATGGNDVFNGKNRIFWYLAGQSYGGGAGYGFSTINWCWAVNFAAGDNCHRIENGSVVVNSVTVYSNSLPHVFNSGHNHPGDYPFVNTIAQGGFGGGQVTINHDVNGNATISMTGSHKGSSGATSTATISSVSLPQIPQTVASPSAATVTRVSDTQMTVNWNNNSTSNAPYQNVKVYRATDGGAYALIATLGVVTTYSDTTTSANHKYTYQVSAYGPNGIEVGFATTSAVWTTPGTPTSLVATKLAGGNIRLTWTNNVNYSEYTVRIEESQNGGAYSEITSVSTGTTTWDHVAPSTSVTHKYRIRARTSSGATLNSSYSNESETITLLATANAPTGLNPAGGAKDAAEAIVFTWTHNPADGTPQSKYQLQYKIDAGSYTTVGPTTSTVSSYTLPAATLTNGHTITWHVATAGENGTIGAYSADATFTTSARPTSTISTPSGGSYTLSHLTANWTYFQAQSSAQSSWHAKLWHKGALSDYSDATLIEEANGSGTTASWTFASTLLDGQTYGLRVYVTSAAGLESIDSGTEREEFSVAYLPPASVTISASYDALQGSSVISIIGTSSSPGVTVDISSVDLQRQIDNSGVWVTWVTGVILNPSSLVAIVVDTMPTIHGSNKYRAVVRSAVPSSALSSEIELVTAEPQWAFLTTGTSFSQMVRMRARLAGRFGVERDKARYHFAGREDPVELSGEAVDRALSVQADLYPPSRGGLSSEPQEVEAIGATTGVVLYRDYTGRRMFSSLSGVGVDYNADSVLYPVSFNVSKIDYDENVG